MAQSALRQRGWYIDGPESRKVEPRLRLWRERLQQYLVNYTTGINAKGQH